MKKPNPLVSLYKDLDSLCFFLNQLHSHNGEPDPELIFESELLRKWVENVLAPLCPTQAQRARGRKGLTWTARAQESIDLYYGYFGKWAYGELTIKLTGATQRLRCSVQPGSLNSFRSVTAKESFSSRFSPAMIDSATHMAFKVWEAVFQQRGFERLKRCHKCDRWFVDKGKNRIAKFCSASCTNRYWNKERRLDSPNYGKGHYGKGKRLRKGGAL